MNMSPYIEWTPAHIAYLLDARVKESRNLDYKRDLPVTKGDGLKEFLADVSAFANSGGGVIIYGIAEEDGEPRELVGVMVGDVDVEILRLDQIISGNLDPSLRGCHPQVIKCDEAKSVLVLRIPQSPNAPHMIRAGGPKFFERSTAGKIPMDSYAIRSAFLASENLSRKIAAFRDERCRLISKKEIPFPLEDSGVAVLHVMPLSAFQRPRIFSMRELMDCCKELRPPQEGCGWGPEIHIEGFSQCARGGPNREVYSYVTMFRDACVESVLPCVHTTEKNVMYLQEGTVLRDFKNAIPTYFEILNKMEVATPFVISLSYLGVKGSVLMISAELEHHFTRVRPLALENVLLPPYEIENTEIDIEVFLKHFSDLVSNACGLPQSRCFKDGKLRS